MQALDLQNVEAAGLSTTNKENILYFQKLLREEVQFDFEPYTTHVFNGGIYTRMLWRPAGSIVVGKRHKKDHLYMVMEGTVEVATDTTIMTLTGPCVVPFPAGTKRAVRALTDATCALVVATKYTTVCKELEEELSEYEEGARFDFNNKILPLQIEE